MARQLRWLGFTCEPLLLSGEPELEIPLLVRSCGVDRVLFGFEEDPDLTKTHILPLHQQLLRGIDVPVCAIGRNVVHAARSAIRNVTLAVSSESRCEIPLSFACRLAQELRAKLTVLRVFDRKSGDKMPATAQAVIDMFPLTTWREAELFCPTEIVVLEGQAADAILNHCSTTRHDVIILCSPGDTSSAAAWRRGVSYRTIAGARCPVFIARSESRTGATFTAASVSEKLSPRETGNEEESRKAAL